MSQKVQDKNPYDIGTVYLVGKYDKASHVNALQDGMGSNPYSVGLQHPLRPRSCYKAQYQAHRNCLRQKSRLAAGVAAKMVDGLREKVTHDYAGLIQKIQNNNATYLEQGDSLQPSLFADREDPMPRE